MIPYAQTEFLKLWFLDIPVHGLFALTGLLLGFIIILGIGRKRKVSARIILAEAFWGLIGAWLGSKLTYYLGPYNNHVLSALGMLNRGFVFYGGLIGGILAIAIYTQVRHHDFWKHSDFWAIGIPLGIFFGRIGCFFVLCCIGRETLFRLGINVAGTIRHPVALYLSLFNLALFCYLYYIKDRREFAGKIFLQYLMIYAVGRFLIDFLRIYEFYYLGLSFSQWTGIAVFAVALPLYIIRSRNV